MITLAKAQEIQNTDIKTVQDAINHYQQTKSKDTLDFIFQMLIPYIYKTGQKRMEMYDSKSLPFDTARMLEEVTSSVTEKLLNHIMSFENQYFGSIYNWIKKVTNNEISDFFRAKKKELLLFEKKENFNADDTDSLDRLNIEHETNQTNTPDNPEQIYLSDELSDELSSLINKLSNKDRLIIYYKFQLEMKNEDIAQVMNVSLSTVAHGVKKAKEALATQVLAYEKKTGTRLHSVAIFEIIGILYYISTKDAEVPESIYTKVSEQITEHVAAEVTKSTGKEVVKRAIKKATDTVTKKIIIGVTVVVIIVGVILGTIGNTPDEPPVNQNTDTQNDATNSQPQTTNKKLEAQLSIITEYYWKHAQRDANSYANAVGRELSHEHYIQLLRDLIVTEDILEQSSDIEMSAQELSDFMQHTLNYQGYDATTDWGQYFSKTESGNFLITAGTSIGYKHTWNFPGANLTEKDKNTIHGFGYVNNRSIEVRIYLETDSLSKLSGYKIQHVDFIFEGAYGYMYLDDFSQSELENIEYLGQIVWDEHYSEHAGRTENLKLYFTLISKMLATDNILNKTVLTSTDNQKYVLVSGQELYDFTLNAFDYEINAGEIEECFARNADGQYVVYATHLPGITAEKANGNQFTVTLSNFHLSSILNYCDNYVVFVYSNIDGKGGTMTILASQNENSPLCGYTAVNAHYHNTAIPQDDIQLLKYLDDIYYQ